MGRSALPCDPPSFFFNDTATTEIYTLSLHDALPIYPDEGHHRQPGPVPELHADDLGDGAAAEIDRKSTRLNSSHSQISYAVFCLKKKKSISVSHDSARASGLWTVASAHRPRVARARP